MVNFGRGNSSIGSQDGTVQKPTTGEHMCIKKMGQNRESMEKEKAKSNDIALSGFDSRRGSSSFALHRVVPGKIL